MIVDHTTTGLLTSTLKTLHRADASAANHLEETGRLMSVGKLDDTNARDLLTVKQVTKKEIQMERAIEVKSIASW